MNAVSEFFVDRLIAVFFFYGLAFFVLGVALLMASRRPSAFRFATAVFPLALFGLLHGAHEWFEMFQKIGAAAGTYTPSLPDEAFRVALLAVSFAMLSLFGSLMLSSAPNEHLQVYWPVAALMGLWIAGTLAISISYQLDSSETIEVADVLSRYILGVPGAVIAAWALMSQQRSFRESGILDYGHDLLWCAGALALYGLLGQIFVRESALPISSTLGNDNFIAWFGIPVQLFRAVLAVVLTIFMVRALRVFELEERRRLEQAIQAKLEAQTAALEMERQFGRQMLEINEELRLATHRLSLVIDISNVLNAHSSWPQPLVQVLDQIVNTLAFAHAGLVLLTERDRVETHVAAARGFNERNGEPVVVSEFEAVDLGKECVLEGIGLCRHVDGQYVRFTLEEALQRRECRHHESPTLVIALPLQADDHIIGSLVLANRFVDPLPLSATDLGLMVGIAQQLGLSVENALLHRQARVRERTLADLLQAVVDAQESERQRMARELHDATGQSLSAIALGLRGVEAQMTDPMDGHQIAQIQAQLQELQSFGAGALQELRRVIADLRPPQLDELGLAAAIRWYAQSERHLGGAACHLMILGEEDHLTSGYKTLLFRIAQEAMANIAKHAAADEVAVILEMEPAEVRLTIEDDGRGFDTTEIGDGAHPGWGLVGIRERALLLGGTCRIDSTPGIGTRIAVCAPIPGAE